MKTNKKEIQSIINQKEVKLLDLANKFVHENIHLLLECFNDTYQGDISVYEQLDREFLIDVKDLNDIVDYSEFPDVFEANEPLKLALENFDLKGFSRVSFLLELYNIMNKDSLFSRLLLKQTLKTNYPESNIFERKKNNFNPTMGTEP